MTAHSHPDANVLTIGCDACISLVKITQPCGPKVGGDGLSAGQRLTARNNALIDAGRHPATHQPLLGTGTCGDCAHHQALENGKTYHKCDLHRLGMSHSAASDIRVGWPACIRFEALP